MQLVEAKHVGCYRKNRTLITLARIMLDEYNTSKALWAEVINTACYASNRLFLQKFLGKMPYEFLNGNKPDVSFFRVFGCKCYIYKKRQHRGELVFLCHAPCVTLSGELSVKPRPRCSVGEPLSLDGLGHVFQCPGLG